MSDYKASIAATTAALNQRIADDAEIRALKEEIRRLRHEHEILKMERENMEPDRQVKKWDVATTGGLGDVIAMESFVPAKNRKNIKRIFYATKAMALIKQLFDSVPMYKENIEHVPVWHDFEKYLTFYSVLEFLPQIMTTEYVDYYDDLKMADDWSIETKFWEVDHRRLQYHGSTFLLTQLADISRLELPTEPFLCIQPHTANDDFRSFDDQVWGERLARLESLKMRGVVVGVGETNAPKHPLLIDLTNRTSIPESVEVLKAAHGFWGVDSWMSVLAAKKFTPEWIYVVSNSGHLVRCRAAYYAPLTDFSFIHFGPKAHREFLRSS
jgi:hypothetical protein